MLTLPDRPNAQDAAPLAAPQGDTMRFVDRYPIVVIPAPADDGAA